MAKEMPQDMPEMDMPEESQEKQADALRSEVEPAIEKCLEMFAQGKYENRNAAIDALISDLEALKTEGSLGGLGLTDREMPLPQEGGDEENDY